jgi:DNA invertase Pin-like site-specific DNA recombinase
VSHHWYACHSATSALSLCIIARSALSAYCGEPQYAEFERAMLKERTKVGLDAAREEGRIGGRRPKLTPQQQVEIRKMVSKGDKTAADAARLFKIHPATVSRLLAWTLPSARKAKHAK